MIIIELCGTPGCGKSYLIDILKEEFSNTEYNIIDMNDALNKRFNNTFLINKAKGFFRKCDMQFSKEIAQERKITKKYLSECEKDKVSKQLFYGFLEEIKYIKNNSNKYDVIIVGEGIVQSISSFSHGHKMNEKALDIIKCVDNSVYKKHDVLLFYCKVDEQTNIDRIRSRNRERDRFIFDETEKIKDALAIKKNNIEYILTNLKNVKKIVIDTAQANSAIQKINQTLEAHGYVIDARNI